MSTLLSSLIILNAFILCLFKPPIIMLLCVIVQALMICVLLKTLFKTAWFSLILFLIFVGGLMILFIYIISLASNNEISFKKAQINMISFMTITMLIIFYPNIFTPESVTYSSNLNNLNFFLDKMYSFTSGIPISMIMVYLLLVLLITVSMVLLKSGPLRSFSKIQ